MADEEKEQGAEDTAAKKGGGLRKILIIVPIALVGVVALAGVGYVGYQKLMAQRAKPEDAIQEIGPMYKLESIISNLGDETGDRFVKVTLELELSDLKLQAELDKRLPQIKQIINFTLASKKSTDLITPQGKGLFAEEILHQINSVLTADQTVRNVYITDIAVQ